MARLNIYHRKDGRWEGRISRGKKDNGQRNFRYIFGKSKEQVRNKMKEILLSEASGNCSKTVQELFNEWLCSAKHRVKESTLANYRLKADKHILPFFASQQITSVSSNDIYAFIDNKQSSGLSNRYIIDILIVMKSVFKHAVRTYHIINPMDGITMPKKGTSEIRLLESDEQHQLEQYISENRNITTMGIALTINGIEIGKKRVIRLMHKMNIQAVYPKPNLSKSDKKALKLPYLLKNLNIDHSNQVWAIDMSRKNSYLAHTEI